MPEGTRLIVTCEHGGHRVPRAYRALFRGKERLLESHRGYDPGTLELAKAIARYFDAPLHAATVSRLLVELNRSLGHPALFSELTRGLPEPEKTNILAHYYFPYREAVEASVADRLARGERVLHLSVHTFTPVLRGDVRRADMGLLYDPRSAGERAFCTVWLAALRCVCPSLRVRRNYPYRGTADSLTTSLRARFPGGQYRGVELEVNQKYARGNPKRREKVYEAIINTLREALSASTG